MLYPKELEKKLGFDKIRILLQEHCQSGLGEALVAKMQFSNDYNKLDHYLRQTSEMQQIIITAELFPTAYYIDVTPHLERARVEGVCLFEKELFDIMRSLGTIMKCSDFFKEHEEAYPHLSKLLSLVAVDEKIAYAIGDIIDREGKLRDDASQELRKIRRQLQQNQSQLRKILERIYSRAKGQGYVPEGSSITIRDGRMVIPLMAEYKRRIKGFVHDESATGQTVYLEPTEALDINNSLRELEGSEKREVLRILTAMTDQIREHLPELRMAYRFLGFIDFIRAKAKLAQQMEATMPSVKPQLKMMLHGARHPLLLLSHQKQGKKVVPLHLILDEEQKILLISGPNAGGKSVCLKTVGLLQYMLQSGLLVPLDAHSEMGIYQDIFIDIGDEQSIENDLSTYSSHLTNMRFFVQHARRKTLFLIDEFGTGTEPQFGGAIAQAILETLLQKGAMGVITTHYTNLKQYAEKVSGISNAAMRFDVQRLEPFYELEIGKPGSSFALEIAKKIGLPSKVLSQAEALVGKKHTDFDQLLNELEKEKQQFDRREKTLGKRESELNRLVKEYEKKSEELEGKKQQIIGKAKTEASQLLSETNKEIEKTIRHIKENKAQKEETKKVREKLEQLKVKVKDQPDAPKQRDRDEQEIQEIQVIEGEINNGDLVRLKGQEVIGQVSGVRGKDIEVIMGELKSTVKRNRLEKVSRKEARQNTRSLSTSVGAQGIDLNQKRANFSTSLDIRGKRAEGAIGIVEQYLDEAIMFSADEVRILHGKGDGILRELIRRHFRSHGYIQSMEDEHVEFGGAGITVVTLR